MPWKILTYGVIAGLIAGIALSIVALNMHQESEAWGMAIGYLIMLVGLSAIFVAIKRQRDIEGGGVIRFWPALGLGVGISLVASIVYTLCWDTAMSIGQIHFGHAYAAAKIAEAKASGMAPDALAKATESWTRFGEQYDRNILYRLPMTMMEILPVGLIVSVLSAVTLWKGWFRPARDTSPGATG